MMKRNARGKRAQGDYTRRFLFSNRTATLHFMSDTVGEVRDGHPLLACLCQTGKAREAGLGERRFV